MSSVGAYRPAYISVITEITNRTDEMKPDVICINLWSSLVRSKIPHDVAMCYCALCAYNAVTRQNAHINKQPRFCFYYYCMCVCAFVATGLFMGIRCAGPNAPTMGWEPVGRLQLPFWNATNTHTHHTQSENDVKCSVKHFGFCRAEANIEFIVEKWIPFSAMHCMPLLTTHSAHHLIQWDVNQILLRRINFSF